MTENDTTNQDMHDRKRFQRYTGTSIIHGRIEY
jgi:hypothetical protein